MANLYPAPMAIRRAHSLTVIFVTLIACFSLQANSQLNFHQHILQSGTSLTQGAVYRFANVTGTGNTDALVTVQSLHNVALKSIDSAYTGSIRAFQPMISSINGQGDHYAQFSITFVQAGTNVTVALDTFAGMVHDLNGSNQINEYTTLDMQNASWSYAGSTPDIGVSQTGSVITGVSQNGNLSQTVDTANFNSSFLFQTLSVTSFTVRFGFTQQSKGWSGNDLFSIIFSGEEMTPTVLPVRLNSFSAIKANEAVLLQWISAVEKSFSHFVVEKSLDGKNFIELAKIYPSEQNNAGKKYQHPDQRAANSNGIIYYRLKLVDQNNSYRYSTVISVSVKNEDQAFISLAPNPARNQLTLSIPQDWINKTVQIQILAINGSRQKILNAQHNSAKQTIQINDLQPGMYVLAAVNGKKILTEKFVKTY